MSLLNKVLKDGIIYTLGGLFGRGINIFLLPFYSRVLTPSQYGAYDFILMIGIFVGLTVPLEIYQGVARYFHEEPTIKQKKQLVSTGFWFSVGMYGLFGIIAYFNAPSITRLLGLQGYLPPFRTAIFLFISTGVCNFAVSQLRWQLRSRAHLQISIFQGLLSFALIISFTTYAGDKLSAILRAQLTASIVTLLVATFVIRKYLGFVFNRYALKKLLSFSYALVPAGIAIWLTNSADRVMLGKMATLDELGQLSVGYRISSLAGFTLLGLSKAITPLIYKHYQEPETPDKLAKLFRWFVAFALAVTLTLSVFADELFILLSTKEFFPGAKAVPLLVISVLVFEMYLFAPGVVISKKVHIKIIIAIVAGFTNVGLNFLLIPTHGLFGASVSTMISSFVFFLGYLMVGQRLYPIPHHWKPLFLNTSVTVLLIFISRSFLDPTFNHILIKVTLLIFYLFFLTLSGLVQKKELRVLWARIKKTI